jgi:hypothetical protein
LFIIDACRNRCMPGQQSTSVKSSKTSNPQPTPCISASIV